jgi:serine protease
MIKNILKVSFVILFVFSSCSKEDEKGNAPTLVGVQQSDPLTAQEINAKINESLQANHSFNWKDQSNYFVWSAIVQGQKVATIGFGNSKSEYDRGKTSNNKALENEILNLILKYEGKPLDKVLISSDSFLNLIDVVIEKQETVMALRNSNLLRYLEPADYRYLENETEAQKSSITSSGCGFDAEVVSQNDFTNELPNNVKIPWSFYQHNIPAAWNSSTGNGITIGIVDSGVSPNQSLLGSNFNNGFSTGRSIQKLGTYVDSFWPWSKKTDGVEDKCGHGTSMAAVAAGSRNTLGLPVGVAYNANLVTYRAAANVFLEGYHEHNGVKNAFIGLANDPNVKIISLSMGYIFSVGKIEDAVRYAYSRGKLIFCAAGTSTSFTNFVGVIFPAWMSETVAVTGVKEGNTFQKCDVCHSGNKVEFTIVMQKSGSDSTVPVQSYFENQSDYVGGSSVATAQVAGIAALVWSLHPTWNSDQVLNKMRQSATFYPNKNSEYGYGNINAALAVE